MSNDYLCFTKYRSNKSTRDTTIIVLIISGIIVFSLGIIMYTYYIRKLDTVPPITNRENTEKKANIWLGVGIGILVLSILISIWIYKIYSDKNKTFMKTHNLESKDISYDFTDDQLTHILKEKNTHIKIIPGESGNFSKTESVQGLPIFVTGKETDVIDTTHYDVVALQNGIRDPIIKLRRTRENIFTTDVIDPATYYRITDPDFNKCVSNSTGLGGLKL